MICPKCGAELHDEQLYCENCGEEIHFVPDFEPEIEQSISDTLSELQFLDEDGEFRNLEETNNTSSDLYGEEVYYDNYSEDGVIPEDSYNEYGEGGDYEEEAFTDEYYSDDEYEDYAEEEYWEDEDYEEEFDEEYDGDPFDEFEYDSHLMRQFIKYIKNSPYKGVFIAGIILIVALILFSVFRISNYVYQNNSYTYQTQLAKEAAANADYVSAIEHMERALVLNSDDSSMKYLLAEYYFANLESDKAILMLWEIINQNDVNRQAAYNKLIDYYASIQDYAMIEEILSNCNDVTIVSMFQNYLANEPEFSDMEGTYDEVLTLRLSSNSNGTIYYTTDGSMPTYESPVYTDPIVLELGIYKVSAFFVNSYGIESDVVTKTYTIDIRVPNAPNVLLDSGEFTSPELIEVDVQTFCKVYYTTDGTLPTIESMEYTNPIPMPIGESHFTFVAFSQEGVSGEYTERDYSLTIDSELDVTQVINNLMTYNYFAGKSVDLEGHLPGNTTKYEYVVSSAITFEDKIYYIFVENLVDISGNTMKTGNVYLADIVDGSIYKTVKDEEGNLMISDLIPPESYVPVVSENAVPVAPQ